MTATKKICTRTYCPTDTQAATPALSTAAWARLGRKPSTQYQTRLPSISRKISEKSTSSMPVRTCPAVVVKVSAPLRISDWWLPIVSMIWRPYSASCVLSRLSGGCSAQLRKSCHASIERIPRSPSPLRSWVTMSMTSSAMAANRARIAVSTPRPRGQPRRSKNVTIGCRSAVSRIAITSGMTTLWSTTISQTSAPIARAMTIRRHDQAAATRTPSGSSCAAFSVSSGSGADVSARSDARPGLCSFTDSS